MDIQSLESLLNVLFRRVKRLYREVDSFINALGDKIVTDNINMEQNLAREISIYQKP